MQCPYCERKCRLGKGSLGFCHMYEANENGVRECFPNRWCAYSAGRMESIPFYHAWPGGRCLVIGTAGCNLDCQYCANAYAAKTPPNELADTLLTLSPENLVGLAQKHGCHALVFSINEPTVSLPTLLEVSKSAKAAGMPMGCLTNGYSTPMATELLGEVFSFFNVSLKGLNPDFCRRYLGIPSSAPIVENIRRLASTRHVEVTTPVVESENDQELDRMADILTGIDPHIPWHIFRLLPVHKMSTRGYPGIEALNDKLESLRPRLPYLYFHNFIGSRWVNTSCPGCGRTVITRHSLGCGGDKLDAFFLDGDRCPDCGHRVRLHGHKLSWNSKEATA